MFSYNTLTSPVPTSSSSLTGFSDMVELILGLVNVRPNMENAVWFVQLAFLSLSSVKIR